MVFESSRYGPEVADILAFDGDGNRLSPLVCAPSAPSEIKNKLKTRGPESLFPKAFAPECALAGLWLYFSCFKECHEIVDDLSTPEGTYWHAIAHRQEPDAGNASYWFRQVGSHPLYPKLLEEAHAILERHAGAGFHTGASWDPFAFVDFCEQARQQPGSEAELAAREIQRAEWQLLFDHCARPRT
ncbi:MAG TPA: hypothetical protein VN610_05620 [Bryobacteraceae bacterium]|nr:hypothetical protein [Bryobacteraceae bacterium]